MRNKKSKIEIEIYWNKINKEKDEIRSNFNSELYNKILQNKPKIKSKEIGGFIVLKKEQYFKQLTILYNQLNFYKKEHKFLKEYIEKNKYKINDI